jgi:hypothetical protein
MSVFEGTGAPRANFVARPYPRRVAGTPTYFFDDVAAGTVELSWDHLAAAGVTEIYVPGRVLAIAADAADALTCASSGALVRCTSSTNGTKVVRVRFEASGI